MSQRPTWVLVLGALGALSCSGNEPTLREQLRIVGGSVNMGDPAVPIVLLENSAGQIGAVCTGTLISKRVVLTAAHCADGSDGLVKHQVYFGYNPFGQSDPTYIGLYDVPKKLVHPQWNKDTLANDIALLQLSAQVPTTPKPPNRTILNGLVGQNVRLVGFGITSGGASDDGVKRQTTSKLAYLDPTIMYMCEQSSGGFCSSAPHNTCSGDSGGPAFMTIGGQEVVVGVTSFGDQNCLQYGASTRVDAYVTSFIDPFVQANDTVSCSADGACAAGCPAVDPDCPCGDDGFCTTACTMGQDPDCPAGCGGGNATCASGCPFADPDCNSCGAGGGCIASGCPSPDPDCTTVPDCDGDGSCNAACQPRDPDCPGAGVGELCTAGPDCESGLCIPAFEDPSVHYCTARCDPGGAGCAPGMDCTPASDGTHACTWPSPTPGALGGRCAEGSDCVSNLCIAWEGASICTALCDPAVGCAAGYECYPTSGAEHVCVPAAAPPDDGDDDDEPKPWFQCAVRPAGRGNLAGGFSALVTVLVVAGAGLVGRRRRRRD